MDGASDGDGGSGVWWLHSADCEWILNNVIWGDSDGMWRMMCDPVTCDGPECSIRSSTDGRMGTCHM
eukprot:scaffold2006_cov141-Isochrysis_galbana.AAC.5